jgi:hypothetical protein
MPPELPKTSDVDPKYLEEATTKRYQRHQDPLRPRTMLPPPPEIPDLGDE